MYSDCIFHLDRLDIIKKFKKLRFLHLKSKKTILIPTLFDSYINLSANIESTIKGGSDNLYIKCLDNLKQLRKMKLFDCNTSYSDIDNEDDSLTLIENGNIVSLGKFNSNDIIHYNFSKLPTLKKIYFNKFSKNILHLISPLTNIQTIYFDELCFNVKEIFNKTNLNGNDLYNKKYNSIKCNSIGEISIDKFNFSFNTLLCFLALFPCLRLLKIRDSFKLESINIKVQYSLTTPLLLIAPIAYEADLAYYDEAERIPMLNLIKLK